MIRSISARVVDFLFQYGHLDEKDREIYVFGLVQWECPGRRSYSWRRLSQSAAMGAGFMQQHQSAAMCIPLPSSFLRLRVSAC